MAAKGEAVVSAVTEQVHRWPKSQPRHAARMTAALHPYRHLSSPITVNRLTIRNRIVMGPMGNRVPNLVSLLAATQRWPINTWADDKARAVYQADKLQRVVADGTAGLVLLKDAGTLVHLLSEPAAGQDIGAVLAVEGAQAVGGDITGVDELANHGVRMLGLAHFFDNAVAGSAQGIAQGGITDFGRQVIDRALAHGMIIDLAHASPTTIEDFLNRWRGAPFVVSHTGLQSVCDNRRNLTDTQLRRIFSAGGLVGIGAWRTVLCPEHPSSVDSYVDRMVESIRHAIALADEEHSGHGQDYVALGSDFDGWVSVGFDASGWPLVTQGLLKEGVPEATIRRVMGGNVCRLLLRALPRHGAPPSPDLCDPR
jgi:membrane dipeptidase